MSYSRDEVIHPTHWYTVLDSISGDGVLSGGEVTPGTGLAVNISAATVLIDGNKYTFNAGSVTLNAANATYPRKDLIIATPSGFSKVTGTPAAISPTGRTRFETESPEPPAKPASSVVLAEVWVAAGATSLTTSDIRDRRIFAAYDIYKPVSDTLKTDKYVEAPGVLGKGRRYVLSFDGADDYVNTPLSINGYAGLTYEAWVNAGDLNFGATNWKMIVDDGNSQTFLAVSKTNYNIVFGLNTGSGFSTLSGLTLSQNQWYHVVGTYDGSYQRIYVNGVLDTSKAWSGNIVSSTTVRVGWGLSDRYWRGLIDEVRIYSRALSDDEIKWNYMHPDDPIRDGLVLWLPMDESTGDTVYDLSGYNNNGTRYGATWTHTEVPTGLSALQERFTAKYVLGRLGIGTTSPAEKLHVIGNVRLDDAYNLMWSDISLYRYAADVLKTDDNFDALALRIGGIEVIDASRNLKNLFADASLITSGRFTISRLPGGASGYVLTGQGTGADPAYAPLPIATRNDVLRAIQQQGGTFWFNNNWLPSGMLSTYISGSGYLSWNTDRLDLHTGASNGSYAYAIKSTAWLGDWGKKRWFRVFVRFMNYSYQYFHIVSGWFGAGSSANTQPHIGFKLINGTLYGTVGNGSSESTISIETITSQVNRRLECVFTPGVECRFYVDGVDKGALTTNLPTGTNYADYLFAASVYNTEAVDKYLYVMECRVLQEE
jgi:hypothetical protein